MYGIEDPAELLGILQDFASLSTMLMQAVSNLLMTEEDSHAYVGTFFRIDFHSFCISEIIRNFPRALPGGYPYSLW